MPASSAPEVERDRHAVAPGAKASNTESRARALGRLAADPLVGETDPQHLSNLVDGCEDSDFLGAILDRRFARAVERAEDASDDGELGEGEASDWRAAEEATWEEALGPGWRRVFVEQVRRAQGAP